MAPKVVSCDLRAIRDVFSDFAQELSFEGIHGPERNLEDPESAFSVWLASLADADPAEVFEEVFENLNKYRVQHARNGKVVRIVDAAAVDFRDCFDFAEF